MSLTPFLDEDRMARPNGHKKVSLDGDGRHRRCRWTLTTDQHAAVVSWHLQKVTVRTDLAGEDQYSTWTQTRSLPRNGTIMNNLVPFGPIRSIRIKTRPKYLLVNTAHIYEHGNTVAVTKARV